MNNSFSPRSNTVALVVGTTASGVGLPAAAGVTAGSELPCLLTNTGANVIFCSVVGAATIPVAGTPTSSFPVLPNTTLIVMVAATAALSAIAAATGNTLYITQGVLV